MSARETDPKFETSDPSARKREVVNQMLPSGFKDDKDYVDYMEYRVRYYPYLMGAALLGITILSTLSYLSH